MVHSRTEIKVIMQALLEQRGFVSIYFNQGRDLLLSSLQHIDTDGSLILTPGFEADTSQRALNSDKLVFISSLNKIKIQFTFTSLEATQYEGREAFVVAMPAAVLRLQRREHFRLVLSLGPAVQCKMSIRQKGEGELKAVVSQVVDISSSGVGMVLPPLDEDLKFDVDTLIEKFSIELPDAGTISGSLQVRSLFDMTQNGSIKRAGCSYVSLSSQMSSMIQRFIIKAERDRKALL